MLGEALDVPVRELPPEQRRGRHRAGTSARGRRLTSRGLGERQTAIALSALPERDWVVMHDVEWSIPDGFSDHLVVGPLGVFTVDSQHWPDGAEIIDGTVWRRGRAWPWATRRADTSAAQVGAMLDGVRGIHHTDVRPAVSLYGVGPLAGHAGRVVVASPTTVCRMLLDHPPVLEPDQVDAAVAHLRRLLRPAGTAAR